MTERQDEAYDQHGGNGQARGDGAQPSDELPGESETAEQSDADSHDDQVTAGDEEGTPRSGRHASRRMAMGRDKPSGSRGPRSIRAKIVMVLMVPVMSLMALWGFATVTTAQNVSELQQLKDVNDTLLTPINDYVTAVQAERVAAARYLTIPDEGTEALEAAGQQTDDAVAALSSGITDSSTDAAELDQRLPGRIDSLVATADYLPSVRQAIVDGQVSWLVAFDAYSETIGNAFDVTGVLTQMDAPGVDFDPRVVLELSLAREMVAQQDAVMLAAYDAEVMTQAQYASLTEAIQNSRAMLWTEIDDPRPSAEEAYRDILNSDAYQDLLSLQDDILLSQAGYTIVGAVSQDEWVEDSRTVQDQLAAGQARVTTIAAQDANLFGFDVLGTSGIAVLIGLVGVMLSLLISVLIGRGLVVELAGLHNSAMDLARRKLPATLRKLNSGKKVDLETEAPQVELRDDEISQVAEALNAVHRSAVQAAIERSDVLKGISGVYVYLARRSQVLLHRQLSLLDNMERRIEDPDQLEDLFRLDHLTTRMRRQAESLIILSGVAPARGWRNPVPMMDVVRAAVAEVEDFTRVEVTAVPEVRISGTAVADLTHLIAELVENAVIFSPPHTHATVRGELVGTGLALEIEDRGLGMSKQAMEDANRRIRETDQVDLLEADQLGLFVVNRLSRRHNVEVTLQRSAYGGVTAIVLVPNHLLDRTAPAPEGLQRPEATVTIEQTQLAAVGALPAPRTPPADQPSPAEKTMPPDPVAPPNHVAQPNHAGPSGYPAPNVNHVSGTGAQPDRPAHEPNHVAQTSVAEPPADGELDELPRRVRKASLRPELRNSPPPPPPNANSGESANLSRSPEEARATLSALRNGWLRGQSEKDES
ncbi:nitrate- and nitrite sensing domain-containing protein [Phytoactinopolyspora endophytica]|uniref:sensor histidine kinase n=1 Tax=Phytoactinopolyspora endophytica TaxID=1642495 RepID=UPI00101CD9FE|nr:nitrate- and nitrite sensing domain-containing protein [Phytoactinopolyspora endophytica]